MGQGRVDGRVVYLGIGPGKEDDAVLAVVIDLDNGVAGRYIADAGCAAHPRPAQLIYRPAIARLARLVPA